MFGLVVAQQNINSICSKAYFCCAVNKRKKCYENVSAWNLDITEELTKTLKHIKQHRENLCELLQLTSYQGIQRL